MCSRRSACGCRPCCIAEIVHTSPGMLTPDQRARLHRLRWSAFVLVALAYILSFFHRVAPAAIADELQQTFQASGAARWARSRLPTFTSIRSCRFRLVYWWIRSACAALSRSAALLPASARCCSDWPRRCSRPRSAGWVGLGVSFMFCHCSRSTRFGFANATSAPSPVSPCCSATPVRCWRRRRWCGCSASPVGARCLWSSVFFRGVLALLTWFVVRDQPREAGLPSMRELEGLAPHAARTGHWWRGLVEVAKNRDTWPGFFPAFGTAGTLLAFAGLWAVPFLRDVYAMPRDVAVLHTSWLLIGFALGSFFRGHALRPPAAAQAIMLGGVGLYLLCWLPLLFQWPLSAATGLPLFS